MTPKGADYLTGGFEGPEGSVTCTIVLVAGIALLAYRTNPTTERKPANT